MDDARGAYRWLARRIDFGLPDYTIMAIILVVAVLVLELRFWRTGLLRRKAYWVTMAICYGFMLPVNGWLTKRSAPVVRYSESDFSGWRPIWDIPAEDYLFGFALLTLSLLSWVRTGQRSSRTSADG